MSEARKGRGRRGGPPEAGPAGSSPGPGRGGSASPMGWIVSANLVALVALGLAAAALILNVMEEDGGGGQAVVGQPSPTVQPTVAVQATPTPVVVQNVSADDDPFIGPDDAPVTIVMFTDYQ